MPSPDALEASGLDLREFRLPRSEGLPECVTATPRPVERLQTRTAKLPGERAWRRAWRTLEDRKPERW